MTVRRARLADLPHLPAIEAAAEALLVAAGAHLGAPTPAPPDRLAQACADRRLFVATPADRDEPVGFLLLLMVDDLPHIAELDVLPAHARRGHGTALVQAALRHAQARGAPAVTLTTFRDIPFNAPFYARQGFTILAEDALREVPELHAVLRAEAAAGFDPAARCAMRGPLRPPSHDGIRALLEAGHVAQVRELLLASPVFALDLSRLPQSLLSRADLSGVSLRGVRFGMSMPTHICLEGCDLTGADLNLTLMSGARLRGARLVEADLRGCTLSGADLRDVNLRDACLRGANLRRARLEGACLCSADLRGADLRDAVLDGAVMVGALTFGARLSPGVLLPD